MIQVVAVRRALLVALVVFGCAAAHDVTADPGPGALRARLDRSLAVKALRGATISALVVDRKAGAEVFAQHPDRALVPASNLKILTGVSALAAFGPAHRFVTEVLISEAPDADGAVATLFVRGGGDPALTSEQCWRLAADLRLRGLRRVRGDLVVDDSLFDAERWHPSWGEVTSRAYYAPVGALSVNYGAFLVVVEAASQPGAAVLLRVDPPIPYLRVSNQARTGAAGSAQSIVVERELAGDHERIVVTGSMPAGSEPEEFWRSVANPTRYAGAVLRMQLEANGIAVDGKTRVASVPDRVERFYDFEGRPLGEVVRLFLKNSNNFIAEALVKSMGVRAAADGSWAAGIRAQLVQLEAIGLDTSGSHLVDGSGLSYENRVSARLLVSALRLADASFDIGPELVAALPIAASDGTLKKRADAAAGQVRAKTGLLTRVTGLSGFARAAGGREVVFSVLANGYRGSDGEAMDALDGFVAELVQVRPETLGGAEGGQAQQGDRVQVVGHRKAGPSDHGQQQQ